MCGRVCKCTTVPTARVALSSAFGGPGTQPSPRPVRPRWNGWETLRDSSLRGGDPSGGRDVVGPRTEDSSRRKPVCQTRGRGNPSEDTGRTTRLLCPHHRLTPETQLRVETEVETVQGGPSTTSLGRLSVGRDPGPEDHGDREGRRTRPSRQEGRNGSSSDPGAPGAPCDPPPDRRPDPCVVWTRDVKDRRDPRRDP